MSTPTFLYGRPVNQLSSAELLGQGLSPVVSSGPSSQVILPGGLPPGTPASTDLLYWNGTSWNPASVDSVIRTWFSNLGTTLPGSINTFWNNGGVLSST